MSVIPSIANWGEAIAKEFSPILRKTAYAKTMLWDIAERNGCLVKTKADWKTEYEDIIQKLSSSGHLSVKDVENAVLIDNDIAEHEISCISTFNKWVLSISDKATIEANAVGVNATPMMYLGNKLYSFERLHDAIIGCGQAARYLDADDPLLSAAGAGTINNGLLFDNVGSDPGAVELDVDTAGDYNDFMTIMSLAFAEAWNDGLDTDLCYVLMDASTMAAMRASVSTSGFYEFNQIR